MKQELGRGRLDMSEFSRTRFESKESDFSDDVLFQITSLPLATHAANNQTRRLEVMGEFILVQAILREAIRAYQKYALKKGNRASRLFREVDEWFSDDDRQWLFSFVNVCDVLALEPTYIRTGLRLWRECKAQSSAPSPIIGGYQRLTKNPRGRMVAGELRG
ncbi:MAG: hypothetical protein WD688_14780 [Candidatus Binatia bacterium]